jgi:methyltransferase
MSLWWVFSLLVVERLFELRVAAKNRRILFQRGGQEFFPESYRVIFLMHLSFMICLIVESYPWFIAFDTLTLACLAAVLLLQLVRYWCVFSLKEYWNTRIILVPGDKVVRRGPYRFLRHPNYLVVTLEFFILPLLARAPLTLVIFSIANLFILRQRITLEEKALREHTDYNQHFLPN